MVIKFAYFNYFTYLCTIINNQNNKKMKNIDLLKKKLEVDTSEMLFDIDKQPEQQCPTINKMQANVKDGCNEIESYCKDLRSVDGAESLASDIESSVSYYMWNKILELEDLRKEIENIRQWGQSGKDSYSTMNVLLGE